MPRTHNSILAAVALVALAGCVSMQAPESAPVNRIDVDSYRLLAELALADQRAEDAAGNYLNAAQAADDPAYAERATYLAYDLGLNTIGHKAVQRWRELDANDPMIDFFAGVFEMRSGRVSAAVTDFSTLLEGQPESEIGRAFELIFQAIGDDPTVAAATQVMLELTERFPTNAQGHFWLAQLALRAGAFGLALDETQEALALEPDSPQIRLLRARTLMLAGRSTEALQITEALADEYDNVAVQLEYAELLLTAGEVERAEALLNDILDQNPGLPEAVRALAFLALSQNDLETARTQFELIRNNPDYSDETFYYLGRIAEMDENFLEATRSYSRVTEGVRAVEAQTRAATVMYQDMDDPQSALIHLEEFGIANPRFRSDMLLARADLLLRLGRAEEGMAMINDAVGDDPDLADETLRYAHISFYALLAQDAMDRGDLATAQTWLDEGLARYPGEQSLRYSQSVLLQEQGELRQAVRLLEDLVDESPNNATYLNGLGYLLTDKLDRHVRARDYIQRALALDPESGAILDSMGWVLFKLGDYEIALDYLERAYRALEVTEVLAHLVDVHWAMGDRDKATEMLRQGLADNPDDAWLTETRDRLQQ
jgi:tetratricopeptide (TPR) repeat protein